MSGTVGAAFVAACCLLALPLGAEVLENESLKIVFGGAEEGFAVKEIVNKLVPGGASYVKTDGSKADLWELNFSCRNEKGDLWHVRATNRSPARSRRAERTDGGLRLVFEGVDVGDSYKGVLDVTAEVALDPETGASRWNVAVTKVRRPLMALCHVEYPCLSCVMEPGAGDIMRPTKPYGMRVQKAWPGEGKKTEELRVPSCYLPVTAFLKRGGGLYVAAHDPDARTKSVYIGPGTDVRFATTVEESGVAGRSAAGPGYDVTIRAFAGDWWRAADLYRDWALRQKWARKGLLADRKDFPQAMRDVDIWLRYNEDSAKAMSNHIERALATWPGLKIGIQWYKWHNSGFCVNFPEFYPPRPGVRETAAFARRKGVVLMPYVDVRLWDTNQVSWAYAKRDACLMEDGRTHGEVYTHTGFRRFHAIMCPSSDAWFDAVRTVTRDAVETGTPNGCGFGAIYFDQLSSAHAVTCYDPRHGHPLGGGRWWTDRHRQIFSEIHDSLSFRNIPVTTENAGDQFLDLVDGHLTCGYFAPDEVPFFQRVYSGRMLHYGGENANLAGPIDTFYARVSRIFAFGVVPGYFDRYRLTDPAYAEQAAWIGAIARCRCAAKEFMLYGELCGEPELLAPVPDREFDVVDVWRTSRNCKARMATFRATLWKARDGRLGLAAVNVTAEPLTVRFKTPAPGLRPLAFDGMPAPACAERDGVFTLTLAPRALAFLAQPPAVTPGYENDGAAVGIFPITEAVWRAADGGFTVEKRDGAAGEVTFENGVFRIVKANGEGAIVVKGRPFAAKKGQGFVFSSKVDADGTIWETSFGMLRAYGAQESFKSSGMGKNGGRPHSWSLPNTPPCRPSRKYEAYVAKEDGPVQPVIVVSGEPSASIWSEWIAEDLPTAQKAWEAFRDAKLPKYESRLTDEAAFETALAKDFDHTAKVVRIDGVSRLVVDGQVTAPLVYRGKHSEPGVSQRKLFFGRELQDAGLEIMFVDVAFGPVGSQTGFWTKDGFDLKSAVENVREAMRIADKSLFFVAIGCTAYPEFTLVEHPDEVWIKEDGSKAVGHGSSCTAYVDHSIKNGGGKWPWPSMASPVWRRAMTENIERFVAELKRQGLAKRIVGIHTFGYHDAQFSIPYGDYSDCAKAEYRRFLAEPGHSSTNYEFFCRQLGFRAQEQFARTFKRALGKDAVAVAWCESPFKGHASSWFVGSFLRSDAIDVLVAQPWCEWRRPALSGANHMPFSSFHLHGKLFFDELDFRTYVAFENWMKTPMNMTANGASDDIEMWRTVFRKHTGTMAAQRFGNWFYEKTGGAFGDPAIAADIGAEFRVLKDLAVRKPSPWKPSVAVVVDEAGAHGWPDGGRPDPDRTGWTNFDQLPILAAAGVPFDVYLAEDVLRDPSLLDGYRLAILSLFKKIDAPRQALVDRFAVDGRTVVFLADTDVIGQSRACGFEVRSLPEADTRVRAVVPGLGPVDGIAHKFFRWRSAGGIATGRAGREVRCSVREEPGVEVLARYAADGAPAVASRTMNGGRRIYVAEPGGLTATLYHRFAAECGAYVALPAGAAQLEMNGDFVQVHALQNGSFELKLPFACTVTNLKTGAAQPVVGDVLPITVTAGETCRFLLNRQ